jgi:V/A-type H+-transporting ATPase subunit A
MLNTVWHLYRRAVTCAEKGIPMSQIKDEMLFEKITKMKYNIPNDDLSGIDVINSEIDTYYDALLDKYK